MNQRYPYLDEFLKHIRLRNQTALNTIEAYEVDLKKFFDWLLTNYGYNNVTRLTKDHIRKFRDYMEQREYAIATIQQHFSALSQFIGYLIQMEIIKEDNDPWPRRLSIRGESPLPHTVPTPREIFRLRMKSNVRLEHAWFLELALSSGMRSDEIQQLVPADFRFGERPYDKELCRPSPYFAGTIHLNPTKVRIKRKRPRLVYFSQISATLTKEYFAKHNLSPDDNQTCIFPWVETNAKEWLRVLGRGVVGSTSNEGAGVGLAADEKPRDKYYTGIDVDALDVPNKFKQLMKRRQEDAAGMEAYRLQASRPLKTRKRHLHPHSLRHMFTSVMYYRNALGERRADSSLRILLGHQDYSTTFIYLRDLPIVDNDSTWRQLWLGKPHDWSGITH